VMRRFLHGIFCVLIVFLIVGGPSGVSLLWADDAPRPARRGDAVASPAGTNRAAPTTTRSARPRSRRGRIRWWERIPPPIVKRIAIPNFPGAHAIWGATGQDRRGHIWFGVSAAAAVELPSARLFEFVPATGELINRGDVVGELKRCGLHRPGEGQMKIHSKIIQADDGHLYFASMDEQNEDLRSLKLPTWGGHLWRLRLPENKWEHLLTTPEPLLAMAGGGRCVYALGYFGHVLYQYDCKTGRIRSVTVGAAGAHISRNFFTDRRGHVYVPRVKAAAGPAAATLVEFDSALREIAETPMDHYLRGQPTHTHGIIGFQPLEDGSVAFLTHSGYLYLVKPSADGPARQGDAVASPAKLSGLGWFYPRGSCYTPSLFTDPGNRRLMGLAQRYGRYDWVIYDLKLRQSAVVAFTLRGPKPLWHRRTLLYGSVVRDKAGNFYVGGMAPREGEGFEPILLQVRPVPSQQREAPARQVGR